MKKKNTLLVAGLASAVALVLAGCSASDDSAGETDTTANGTPVFGECEITSERDSIEFELADEGTLTVATVLPNPGWWNGDSPDQVQSGFEYCMAAEIANMAGADTLELKNLAWDQYISGTATGFDIAIAGTTITDERREIFDFSAPYFESNLGIVVKDGADVTEDNLTDLRIGALQGNMGALYVQDELGVTPQLFQGQNDMFTALQANQVDAVITDTTLALTYTNASNGAMLVTGQIQLDQGYGAVTPKGHANTAPLAEAVDVMLADGTTDRLSQTWLEPFFGTDPNSIPFWTVG